MCPELILWDWNGTLLDDVDLCVDALNRLLAGFGYPQRYDHERYRAIFGFPIEEYYVRAGFDFTKHSFAELAEKYMEDYVPASAACPLADGAIDALEAFKAAGLRQVILSASNLDTLRRQTDERGVTGYFDRLLGLGDIYAKSKVEVGLAYLKENGFDPARAVMIGDSVHDYEVAQALGVRCVLQSGGHPHRNQIRLSPYVYHTVYLLATRAATVNHFIKIIVHVLICFGCFTNEISLYNKGKKIHSYPPF